MTGIGFAVYALVHGPDSLVRLLARGGGSTVDASTAAWFWLILAAVSLVVAFSVLRAMRGRRARVRTRT